MPTQLNWVPALQKYGCYPQASGPHCYPHVKHDLSLAVAGFTGSSIRFPALLSQLEVAFVAWGVWVTDRDHLPQSHPRSGGSPLWILRFPSGAPEPSYIVTTVFSLCATCWRTKEAVGFFAARQGRINQSGPEKKDLIIHVLLWNVIQVQVACAIIANQVNLSSCCWRVNRIRWVNRAHLHEITEQWKDAAAVWCGFLWSSQRWGCRTSLVYF